MELDAVKSPDDNPVPVSRAGICTRPIDLVFLARYTLGNRALEREVLELFVGQSRQSLEQLRKAESTKDWREAAHAIKGSARAVGARRVGDLAEQAELLDPVSEGLVSAAEQSRRAELVRDLSDEIDAANQYIAALFNED